jgi:hypothetical protein
MTVRKKTLGFRATEELYTLVTQVSSDRGENTSDFIRRSIRKELASLSYYPEHVKKALGIKGQNLEGRKTD